MYDVVLLMRRTAAIVVAACSERSGSLDRFNVT